ncbi:MAG: hypothetical protein ACXVB4_18590 [Pseudobdellovibrionaceae bacterium]
MAKKLLNNSWFYFALSLVHQCLVILPGEFPKLFPDSGSYLTWYPHRTPLYPFLLSVFQTMERTAVFQMFVFAFAAAAFHQICRSVLGKLELPQISPQVNEVFLWIGSLYFATNFEMLQFAPTILTESLGISFFTLYFFALLRWTEQEKGPLAKFYFVLSFVFFPILLFMLRPSFILVPAALTFFHVLKTLQQKKHLLCASVSACLLIYAGTIEGYAYWNQKRIGHVGISDIAQHQIFANYMARGILKEEGAKEDSSAGLKAFARAYEEMDPTLRDSQYSLFGKWAELNPGKDLYTELVPVNKELLAKRPFGYVQASLRNLSSLIDGRASFNYYPIVDRDLPSKLYFWLQFALDNIFCVLWFTALIYFFATFRRRPLFGLENLIFLPVATQFLTIAVLGYSELRRQSVGVAAAQMLFVLIMWAHLTNRHWEKKAQQRL